MIKEHIRIIMAIFIKDLKDIKTNLNSLSVLVLPFGMMFLFQVIPDIPEGFDLFSALVFLVGMTGVYIPAVQISEEKEKNTLETLFLTPATPLDIVFGKGLLILSYIIVCIVILLLIKGVTFVNYPIYILGGILASLASIIIGILIGVFSSNQIASGLIGMPIYIMMIAIPIYSEYFDLKEFEWLFKLLPTYSYYKILNRSYSMAVSLKDVMGYLGFIFVVIIFLICMLLYIFKKTDDFYEI